jgi:hypothetical protein
MPRKDPNKALSRSHRPSVRVAGAEADRRVAKRYPEPYGLLTYFDSDDYCID